MNHPKYCSHRYDDGRPCHGYAGKGGLCPPHAGRNARMGARPSNQQLAAIEREREGFVAACSCVTGKDASNG